MPRFRNVCLVVGTRPEIIKTASIIHELKSRKINFFIVHSNQHYSSELDAFFFDELDLPKPKHNLNIGSGKHCNQIGRILLKLEPVLEQEKPDLVIVQGDTNTVLAAGLAATKHGIKLAHIEAGLRSYDRSMPEETNRITVDHLADYLFSVTSQQTEILLQEGIEKKKIFEVGNTVIDTLLKFQKKTSNAKIFVALGLKSSQKYILLTAHRAANVDTLESASKLVNSINKMAKVFDYPIVFPIHPRSRVQFASYKLDFDKNVKVIDPLKYSDFIALLANAAVVVTDSGGIQEESSALKTPCVTIRENTERPETIAIGANVLVGSDSDRLIDGVRQMLASPRNWTCPYGSGDSSKKIIDELFGLENVFRTKVAVVGMGYMGLPMACILADSGHDVIGIDIDLRKISKLSAGQNVIKENGFDELFARCITSGGIQFSAQMPEAPVYVVSVPTPQKDHKCDLTYVIAAVESVLKVAPNGSLLIIESTIKPRTCSDIIQPMVDKLKKNILVAHCPERAIPGNTLHELVFNDRIVGGTSPEATARARNLYATFCKGTIYTTDSTTAECAKLMENTFRDVNIALANDFDNILYEYNVDAAAAISLANKHPRVSILQPGIGVGGHCIAVDPWFFIEDSEKGKMIRLARDINSARPEVIAHRLKIAGSKLGKKIGLLGYAYKPNVDDPRETPVEDLRTALIKSGFEVKIHDPLIAEKEREFVDWRELEGWADFFFISTDHTIFKEYSTGKSILRLNNLVSSNEFETA